MKLQLLVLLPVLALANERKFGYVNETPTMPVGQKELEVWNTVRAGGESFTSSIDQRLEFEVGVGPSTQASLYLNAGSVRTREGSSSQWKGFSIEVKHQLSDPAADPIGSALYLEAGVQPDELELEGKLLLDKKSGPLTVAFNAVAEGEFEWEVPPGEKAELGLEGVPLEADLGVAWSFSTRLALGLEARLTGEYQKSVVEGVEDWELEGHALFLGPTLSFGADSWWASTTVLPRLAGIDRESQAVELRLLAGFHF